MTGYEDIIHLPHHVSVRHPQMSRQDRAAQFAPFAALTGHKDAIRETERLTERKRRLSEDCRQISVNPPDTTGLLLVRATFLFLIRYKIFKIHFPWFLTLAYFP